jgi:Tfp pilus assembly protein PilX
VLRSIRSCSRVRTNRERGFALMSALAVAVLYFMLMELLLVDAQRELEEARRFRSRVVAATLAENGAELAALKIAEPGARTREASADDWQGRIRGTMRKDEGGQFEIEAEGTSAGLAPATAKVRVYGRLVGNDVRIQYTIHTP